MSKKNITKVLKKYQEASGEKRQEYLRAFEEKMIYRTTKTENPETTLKMVRQILSKETTPEWGGNQPSRFPPHSGVKIFNWQEKNLSCSTQNQQKFSKPSNRLFSFAIFGIKSLTIFSKKL